MALRLNPDDNGIYWIYYFRGWAKREIGRFDDAIADFNEGISQLSDRLNDFYHKAKSPQGKWEEEEEQEEKNIASALQLLYINRGNVKAELSKICEARQDFQMARQLASRSSDPTRVDRIQRKLNALDSLTTQHHT